MELPTLLAELESLGTEQNRKIYRRHGLADPMFGVSSANLAKFKKQSKRDQALAEGLWSTGNYDAQQLALMAADPTAFDVPRLQAWVESANCYAVADPLAREIVIRTPYAFALAESWLEAESIIIQRAGWSTIGCLALYNADVSDDYLRGFLPRIEANIHTAPNRIKEAMNSALIAMGSRNENLRVAATEAAARIGKVLIDHGETDCKTPDAATYIAKTFARRLAKATA